MDPRVSALYKLKPYKSYKKTLVRVFIFLLFDLFCCLGFSVVVFFCCLGGLPFFFAVWACFFFFFLLFGRGVGVVRGGEGGDVFFLLFGRGTAVHSLTGLPGSFLSDPTTKKTKQQKKRHGCQETL